MKNLFKIPAYLMMGAAMTLSFASCSDDENDGLGDQIKAQDEELKPIVEQFINGTVYPTYQLLAAETEKLTNGLVSLRDKASKGEAITDEEIKEVAETFLAARAYYEESEAFLFGSASDYGIDPHIDTWPLSVDALHNILKSEDQIKAMNDDEGQYANGSLNQSVLGFHGIEYILFRDGNVRTAQDIANGLDDEMSSLSAELQYIFARAVSADLRNSCYRMEVTWNRNAPASHIDWLTTEPTEENPHLGIGDLEWSTTSLKNPNYTYGELMMAAGQSGVIYTSWRSAVDEILIAGCKNISDEVGNVKLGNPISGADEKYIESPYSKRSKIDFTDNIESIENVYMGGRPESRDESKSLHAYMQKKNPDLDKQMTDAIANAKAKINAIPGALVDYIKNQTEGNRKEGQAAIDACLEVSTALQQIDDFILNH